jgi:hypothetical protein
MRNNFSASSARLWPLAGCVLAAIVQRTRAPEFVAFVVFALVLFAFPAPVSKAADITCLRFYETPIGGIPADKRAALSQLVPSGRLPDTSTCRKGLIRGEIRIVPRWMREEMKELVEA